MASMFRSTYRTLQRQAHEYPVIFYSLVLGAAGPIMVLTVPPVRRSFGWTPAPPVPTSYPVPDRPRREVKGYDDE